MSDTPERLPYEPMDERQRAIDMVRELDVTKDGDVFDLIARLLRDVDRIEWLERGLRDDMCKSCHFRAGGWLFSRADWSDDTRGWNVARKVTTPFVAEGARFREAIDAARKADA